MLLGGKMIGLSQLTLEECSVISPITRCVRNAFLAAAARKGVQQNPQRVCSETAPSRTEPGAEFPLPPETNTNK